MITWIQSLIWKIFFVTQIYVEFKFFLFNQSALGEIEGQVIKLIKKNVACFKTSILKLLNSQMTKEKVKTKGCTRQEHES